MSKVTIFTKGGTKDIQVSDDFAVIYASIEHRDSLTERKETRRHQSLGEFDIPDGSISIFQELEREQIVCELKRIFQCLSERQRFVLIHYVAYDMSFREIGDELGLHKNTVKEHYYASVKKLQKFLKKHPFKMSLSWLLGGGLKPYLKNGRTLYGTKQTANTEENDTCDD